MYGCNVLLLYGGAWQGHRQLWPAFEDADGRIKWHFIYALPFSLTFRHLLFLTFLNFFSLCLFLTACEDKWPSKDAYSFVRRCRNGIILKLILWSSKFERWFACSDTGSRLFTRHTYAQTELNFNTRSYLVYLKQILLYWKIIKSH